MGALETGRKVSYQQAFLTCFSVNANIFYIYLQCTYLYIVFISQCQKV